MASGVKIEPKVEGDLQSPGQNNNSSRGGGSKRRRGGGAAGPGRNFMGGRGGGGHFGDRRPFQIGEGYDGPNKKPKMGMNPEQRVIEKIRASIGPTADLPPRKYEVKKFLANTRLYVGNISNEATEAEVKELFTPFGEIDELFLNREKNFAFLKLDYRTNAERARSELDQKQLKGRPIKVRFAPATVRLKVKNLSPMVSNELLELAFSVFGDIEKALVFVDDKGKSLGEGIVDFARKNNAMQAHKFCTEKCYFLTSDLRPVVTEIGDMFEVDEGLLESNMPKREYTSDRKLAYYKAREQGPRLAEEGSFEHEYASKWKTLIAEFQEKEKALKEEMTRATEKLQTQMEMARYDYETELLRQQLRQRELDHERQKMQWEQRISFGNPSRMENGGLGSNNGPDGGSASMEQDNNSIGDGSAGAPLAPPPMPPQGLMQQLSDDGAASAGPTWEIGPFFGQMSGNFGQPPSIRANDQRDGRFGGPGGPPRSGMGGPRGGPRGGGGGRGGFRGGRGGGVRR